MKKKARKKKEKEKLYHILKKMDQTMLHIMEKLLHQNIES